FVAVGDLNRDGKPDLVAANYRSASVLINAVATTTSLVSSLNPSNLGQAVTFTATVTTQAGGMPTGSVSFYDGSTWLGDKKLNQSDVAKLTTSTLTVGTHPITATYNGDSTFAQSTSAPLNQVVQSAIAVVSPTALNFGTHSIGVSSKPQNVTVQ